MWAITGEGGIGKTKLAWEFIKQEETDECWTKLFISSNFFEGFPELYHRYSPWKYPSNLLVVIDDDNKASAGIGNWLRELKNTESGRENKIRILLLERESEDYDSTKEEWTQPFWYKRLLGNIYSNQKTPPPYTGRFMKLDELSEQDNIGIVESYLRKKHPEKNFACQIEYAKKLIKVNKDNFNKPLYLLFLADAISKGENINNWSDIDVLNWLYEYEVGHICQKLGDEINEVVDACLCILTFTTMVGGIYLNDLPVTLENQNQILVDYFAKQKGNTIERFFASINIYNAEDKIILPLKPDLFGEYFCIKNLKSMFEKNKNLAYELSQKKEIGGDKGHK